MYFIVISSLLFALAFSAPQDLATEGSESYAVKEYPSGPVVYETPTEAKVEYGNVEYTTKAPEVPVYEAPTDANYVPKEEYPKQVSYQVATDANTEYAAKEPEVAYEIVTEAVPETVEVEVDTESRPLKKETVILNAGKQLSEALTAKIVGPVVLFNSKVAAAAGALPPMLAAKGAVIGSALATPIEMGAVAGSGIVSGVTGKLVAVPISVGAGAVAKFVSAAESGQQIWDFNIQHGGEVVKNGLIKIGHILLKPVAVVAGAQTALTGAGLGVAGTGIKGVGVGMEAVGAKLVASGLVAKGLGHRLIAKHLPPYVK